MVWVVLGWVEWHSAVVIVVASSIRPTHPRQHTHKRQTRQNAPVQVQLAQPGQRAPGAEPRPVHGRGEGHGAVAGEEGVGEAEDLF